MRARTSVIATALVVVGLGCKVGEEHERPALAAGEMDGWSGRLDGVLTEGELEPAILAEWWTTLEDETLSSLVARAAEANLDLRSANAQVRQARAQRKIASAAGSPSARANAGGTRTGTDAGTTDLFSIGLDASWEIDVFGGIARATEAAEADLQAVNESRRDVLVTVFAEVALNYVDLRTTQRRREITLANLESLREGLGIVHAKFEAGAVSEIDLDRATSNLELTRSQLPVFDQQIQGTMNRLALLLGETPGALHAQLSEGEALPVPDVRVAIGVPAEVLRRRPDVRRAERQLVAETARVGVAIAELYPKFSLGGTVGLESISTSSLFDAASGAFSLGPRMQWNLFDGGRTRQQIEVQNAIQEQALVEYERAILVALEDVQNAVTAFGQERLRLESLEASSEAAERAASLAELRYSAGETDYLEVLDAQRTRLSAQDDLAQSEGLLVSNLVSLYKALGGGWDGPNEAP